MSIPLVQNNEKDSINTSIIAIKKNLERINSILGLVGSGSDIDTSEFVRKSDIVDVVQSGNMNPVTSNAVAESLSYSTTEQKTGGVWIDGKPIYRRTIHLQNISPTDNAKIVYTLEDYANISITKLDWLAKMTNNLVFSNFYNRRMEGGNGFFNVYYYQNNGQFRYICYDFTTADLYITIEYTKTT